MSCEMGGTIICKNVKENNWGGGGNNKHKQNRKASEQCRIPASQGNQNILGMIRRNITYKEK